MDTLGLLSTIAIGGIVGYNVFMIGYYFGTKAKKHESG